MPAVLAHRPQDLVITGARIVDPHHPHSADGLSRIRVSGSTIREIGPAAAVSGEKVDLVIDADGRFAVPGLVNAHDHLYSHELREPLPGLGLAGMRRWLDSRTEHETMFTMLATAQGQLGQGITTIRDLGAAGGLNTVLAGLLGHGTVAGPTIVAAGRPVVMTGGHVWTFGRQADGPWDCRRAVREQARAGAQVIKIMGSGGLSHYPAEDFTVEQFTDEELAAVIDEAHRVGLPTCSHVFGAEAVERVVRLGIDSVEHGVQISDETLELMARNGVGYVPTLTNMERIASPEYNAAAGTPGRSEVLTVGVVEPHRQTVRRAMEAGVRIAVGTDSTGDYTEELVRLVELGMDPQGALIAATINGAHICRQPAGLITPGLRADLALYSDDPRDDISVLTHPGYVVSAGAVVRVPM